ncbi:hypothetical protein DEU56DRAFT_396339 [Suillus clintonianus]|uniref:uncharacterized protein n=1 Tax=Suillus clintonianus TaxID=1904413 RepID=UPI001B885946|nr:uncharacterized protein DEU56DRAFT_396339 [Suillus clintonianus]KAG2135291.1 hypothetical protein DEU56DRAFT_396339 [Suillus clintonianus]
MLATPQTKSQDSTHCSRTSGTPTEDLRRRNGFGLCRYRVLNVKHATAAGSSAQSSTQACDCVAGGCIFFVSHQFVSSAPKSRLPESFPVLPSQPVFRQQQRGTPWLFGSSTPGSTTIVCCVPRVTSFGQTSGWWVTSPSEPFAVNWSDCRCLEEQWPGSGSSTPIPNEHDVVSERMKTHLVEKVEMEGDADLEAEVNLIFP